MVKQFNKLTGIRKEMKLPVNAKMSEKEWVELLNASPLELEELGKDTYLTNPGPATHIEYYEVYYA